MTANWLFLPWLLVAQRPLSTCHETVFTEIRIKPKIRTPVLLKVVLKASFSLQTQAFRQRHRHCLNAIQPRLGAEPLMFLCACLFTLRAP